MFLPLAFLLFPAFARAAEPGAEVARPELVVTGAQRFPPAEIARWLEDDLQAFARGQAASHLRDAAWRITERYHDEGYPFVKVTCLHLPQVAQVVVKIVEGRRVLLRKVDPSPDLSRQPPFQGVSPSHKQAVQAILDPRTPTGTRLLPPYSERLVQARLAALRAYYHSHGYIDLRLERQPQLRYHKDQTQATVDILLDEGPQYWLGKIEFSGNRALSGPACLAATGLPPSAIYDPDMPASARLALLRAYGDAGYPYVAVRLEVRKHPAPPRVDLAFTITEGRRRKIRRVNIHGHRLTRESTLRRRLRTRPGDFYCRATLREDELRLSRMPILRYTAVQLVPVDPDEVDVNVTVEEAAPHDLSLRLGYGSYQQLRGGFRYAYLNLLGLGQRVSLDARVSQKDFRLQTGWGQPHFLGTDVGLEANLHHEEFQEVSFKYIEQGLTGTCTVPWSDQIKVQMGLLVTNTRTFDVAEGVELAGREDFLYVAPFSDWFWDWRDDPQNPGRGGYLSLHGELGSELFGSEVEEFKLRGRVAGFFPLPWRVVLGLVARGGVAYPLRGTTDLPLSHRFYGGGLNSVRGFRERMLGPLSAKNKPIGGEAFAALNAELRFPVWGDAQLAVFYDTGMVWSHPEEVSWTSLRYGVGAGVRYVTPVGPLLFDVGYNPAPRKDEPHWVPYLSVMYTF